MREIKFRAIIKGKMELVEGYASFDEGVPSLDIKLDSPLMQYTGLKDKNGKEIYEGDIIRTEFGNFAQTVIETNLVSFDNLGYLSHLEYLLSNKEVRQSIEKIEVIGNIYENPNLLKDNK